LVNLNKKNVEVVPLALQHSKNNIMDKVRSTSYENGSKMTNNTVYKAGHNQSFL
jgi:hypothetical protein